MNNPGMTKLPDMLDLAFDVSGATPPANYPFALWAALLKHNRVGQVTVFNFLIPVFGALLSALFLGETVLEWRNLIALALVCGGIWLVTTETAAAPAPARAG